MGLQGANRISIVLGQSPARKIKHTHLTASLSSPPSSHHPPGIEQETHASLINPNTLCIRGTPWPACPGAWLLIYEEGNKNIKNIPFLENCLFCKTFVFLANLVSNANSLNMSLFCVFLLLFCLTSDRWMP